MDGHGLNGHLVSDFVKDELVNQIQYVSEFYKEK